MKIIKYKNDEYGGGSYQQRTRFMGEEQKKAHVEIARYTLHKMKLSFYASSSVFK